MRSHLFLIISTFIFIKFVSNQNQNYFYEPKEALEFINRTTYDSDTLQFILNSLSKTFQDAYAFNEISKNPPKTKFSEDYFKKVDIQKRLKEINTNNTSVYKFYQDLRRALADLEDLHIHFDISRFVSLYTQIYLIQPIQFYIKMHENKPRIFGKPYLSQELMSKFKDYGTVSKVIKENSNEPILTINGKDPFIYITTFGNEYLRLKSPYATFVYKFLNVNNINNANLYQLPLSLKDLTNFAVVYENEKKFKTDFVILSKSNLNPNETKSSSNNELNNIINSNLLIKDNINAKIDNFENVNVILGQNSFNDEKMLKDEKDFKWNHDYNNIFKCRVDDKNKVNVYLIKKFGDGNNIENFFQAIEKCVKLFDGNKYPIILINSFNPGGIAFLSHILLELLSPKISLNMYGAYRKTSTFKSSPQLDEYFSLFANSENCESLTYDHLIKKNYPLKYSDDISDVLTERFIILNKDTKKRINDIKKNLKNPRNPTDILVLTDGFSYSSAALFLKYLQYYGGAITAGYFINPSISNIPFDSGLSPSITFDYIRLQLLSPEGYKPLYDKFKWSLSIPGVQTFYNPDNYSIPLEFDVTPVDKKINLYEVFNESNYEVFINESIAILNNYKNSCNPDNKKLILIKNECDKSFENTFTHGGYQCGENGTWIEKCVASYCDIGYIFDHNKHKCIIDVCSKANNKDNIYNYIVYSALGLSLISFIIIIIIIICKNKRNAKIGDIESGGLMDDD